MDTLNDFYRCEHFKIYELVDPDTYSRFRDDAWMFFQPRPLIMLDGLWQFFNDYRGVKTSLVVNDWWWKGQYQWSGLRPITCSVGAKYSQHRLANGFDVKIEGVPAEEARQQILANQEHELLRYVMCIEGNVSWLHVDSRNIKDRIRIVYP